MSIRPVVKMGNKKLATPSLPVELSEIDNPDFLKLIEDMKDTMEKKGGVGIAAPQIGCNKRVILFGFENNERYPKEKPVPFTILINPTFKVLSQEINEGWEGCLSVPGLRGLVPRHNKIEYSGYGLDGKLLTRSVEGFHAKMIQHECDHLDGILFPQRIKNLQFFGFEDELGKEIFKSANG